MRCGSIQSVFLNYPRITAVLPAMGYSREQIRDLEQTINAVECDLVLFATPINLTRLLTINKPTLRVRYEYRDYGEPRLEQVLLRRMEKQGLL